MSALVSLENVSVGFPVKPVSPVARSGRAQDVLRRLRYKSQFGQHRSVALRNIWLSVGEGERLAVIGPNGSGKSTLLRVMSGTIPHHSGRITRVGEVAAILSAQAGFMAQATGYENIFLRGLVLGLTHAEVEARLKEIIKFAALGDWLYQPVTTYSNGMALRLAFAISTCVSPDIVIMDEWIGAGDARFINAASERLRTMIASSRILILASHNEKVIREFCTRAVVMFRGSIVFSGNVADAMGFYDELNGSVEPGG